MSLLQFAFRFVFLFMALLWAVVSLMCCVLRSVCLLVYPPHPPSFFPSKQTSPVLLFISSTRCRISLQQNGQRGGGGRRETDSRAQSSRSSNPLVGWRRVTTEFISKEALRFCMRDIKTGCGNAPWPSPHHRTKDSLTFPFSSSRACKARYGALK